jgi:hypothetical protein
LQEVDSEADFADVLMQRGNFMAADSRQGRGMTLSNRSNHHHVQAVTAYLPYQQAYHQKILHVLLCQTERR